MCSAATAGTWKAFSSYATNHSTTGIALPQYSSQPSVSLRLTYQVASVVTISSSDDHPQVVTLPWKG